MRAKAIIKKIKKLSASVAVSLTAFFELCFTGKADRSWRLARADSFNLSLTAGAKGTPTEHPGPRPGILVSRKGAGVPPPASAPIYLSRLVIVLAIAVLLIVGVLLSVEKSTGTASLHQKVEDGTGSSDRQHGPPKEGRPSSIDRAAAAAVTVCLVISLAIVISYCVTENKPRKAKK